MKSATELRILNEELRHLNDDVFRAIQVRTDWMNNHMIDYVRYPIGEVLYSRMSGEELGKVVGYYRTKEDKPFYDTAMNIDYKIKSSTGFVVKSSNLLGVCNKAELITWSKS